MRRLQRIVAPFSEDFDWALRTFARIPALDSRAHARRVDNFALCAGVKKKYSVPVLSDVEFLSANIDKSTYAARFTAKPNVLTRFAPGPRALQRC
jgi:hypothetical protein